jgi:prepilin-type processing-associated H-X9-DG protein
MVELMVVIIIIGLLVALLLPAASAGWDVASMTRCQRNLNVIWQAQALWRAENDGRVLSGKAWIGRLRPYVEQNLDVFKCPSAPTTPAPSGASGETETDTSDVPPAGGGTSGGYGSYPVPQPPGSEKQEAAFEFNIYWRQGSTMAGGSGSTVRGELAYQVPLDSHPWVRRTPQGDGSILYEVDDEGSTGGAGHPITYDDIKFTIYYDNGSPSRLEILKQSCGYSPYAKYFFDFLINGEVLVQDWVKHIGQSYDLSPLNQPTGGGGDPGSSSGGGGSGGGRGADPAVFIIVLADYGISKGCYASITMMTHSVDPKLFFILDYPVPLADFCGDADDQSIKWDKYFIQDPVRWQQDWGQTGEDWTQYQSLRHFGQANVLFCDGHIELLGPEDLQPLDPRWR